MSLSVSVWWVIALAVVFANLPFLNNRLLVLGPTRSPKSLPIRLLELVSLYLLLGGVSLVLERIAGQIYPQRWEFYATTATLFITLAFPGFVFRYLRKR